MLGFYGVKKFSETIPTPAAALLQFMLGSPADRGQNPDSRDPKDNRIDRSRPVVCILVFVRVLRRLIEQTFLTPQ